MAKIIQFSDLVKKREEEKEFLDELEKLYKEFYGRSEEFDNMYTGTYLKD